MMKFFDDKRVLLGIGAGVILLGVLAWIYIPRPVEDPGSGGLGNDPYVIEVSISDEERADFETQIVELKDAISKGDTGEAEDHFAQYLQIGLLYQTLGELRPALEAFRHAEQIRGNSYVPFANMASVYASAGAYEDSKQYYRRAIQLAPSEQQLFQNLAEVYWYKVGDIEVARGVYLEGLIRTNNNPDLMRGFASFLEQVGYTDESVRYWEVLLDLLPGDEGVKDALRRLSPGSLPVEAPEQPVEGEPGAAEVQVGDDGQVEVVQ